MDYAQPEFKLFDWGGEELFDRLRGRDIGGDTGKKKKKKKKKK